MVDRLRSLRGVGESFRDVVLRIAGVTAKSSRKRYCLN